MDEKYLWPLVGVVLGWLLTVIATTFKGRAERLCRIGRVLSKLILVHTQLRVLIAATEEFKNHMDDWVEYERYRKLIAARHFLEPPEKIHGVREAIDEVSGDYPLLAIEFQGLMDSLLKSKNSSMQESAKSKELYIRMISVHEVTLDLCEKKLMKQILLLARMHGLGTHFRVKKLFRNTKASETGNHAFLAKLTGDMFEESKRLTKSKEQNAVPPVS